MSAVLHRQSLSTRLLHVIFDNYDTPTTKDLKQKRRRHKKILCPDNEVTDSTPVPKNNYEFLAKKHNKQKLVDLIAEYLQRSGVLVTHASDEGDADVVIVRAAFK